MRFVEGCGDTRAVRIGKLSDMPRGNLDFSARLLCRSLEKGNAEPHLASGSRCVKRVSYRFEHLAAHSAAVVGYGDNERAVVLGNFNFS